MMKSCLGINLLLLVLMIVISGYGWIAIPEEAMIARHWNLAGEADGYSPRNHILIGLPLLAIILSVLFYLIPRIDPRAEHVRASSGLLVASWLGVLLLLLSTHAAIVMAAANGDTAQSIPGLTLYGVSLLLIVIGNFTAKSKSNFFLGVRTPWTLSSEHAWAAANRTTGWVFVLTGFATILTGLLADLQTGLKVLIVGAIAGAIGGIAISYIAWSKDPERKQA